MLIRLSDEICLLILLSEIHYVLFSAVRQRRSY